MLMMIPLVLGLIALRAPSQPIAVPLEPTRSDAPSALLGNGTMQLDFFKYYDTNASGTNDGDDFPLPRIRIAIVYTPPGGTLTNASVVTGPTGGASFDLPAGSTFMIGERIPIARTPGFFWKQTFPNSATSVSSAQVVFVNGQWQYSGIAVGGTTLSLEFANVCIGEGGGRTPGFWSNQNGEAILGANDPAWRNLLNASNLRDAAGNHFTVPGGSFSSAYSEFRTWLLGATATNMAYRLSSHLAAMKLNVNFGFVSNDAIVFAPGTNSANAAGFASLAQLLTEADSELGLHGTALAGDSWRSYQETLKDALDAANNNGTFAQSESCGIDP